MAGLKRPVGAAGPDVKKIAVKLESALRGDREKQVRKAAIRAKAVHLTELKKASSTLRLRNVGKNGTRLGINYQVKAKGYAQAEGLIQATPRVAFHIIEKKSKRHWIWAGTRDGYSTHMPTPYGYFTKVDHPGVQRPKYPFNKGYAKAKPYIRKVMRDEVFQTVKDNYKL